MAGRGAILFSLALLLMAVAVAVVVLVAMARPVVLVVVAGNVVTRPVAQVQLTRGLRVETL